MSTSHRRKASDSRNSFPSTRVSLDTTLCSLASLDTPTASREVALPRRCPTTSPKPSLHQSSPHSLALHIRSIFLVAPHLQVKRALFRRLALLKVALAPSPAASPAAFVPMLVTREIDVIHCIETHQPGYALESIKSRNVGLDGGSWRGWPRESYGSGVTSELRAVCPLRPRPSAQPSPTPSPRPSPLPSPFSVSVRLEIPRQKPNQPVWRSAERSIVSLCSLSSSWLPRPPRAPRPSSLTCPVSRPTPRPFVPTLLSCAPSEV